jgi:hypothetical protein
MITVHTHNTHIHYNITPYTLYLRLCRHKLDMTIISISIAYNCSNIYLGHNQYSLSLRIWNDLSRGLINTQPLHTPAALMRQLSPQIQTTQTKLSYHQYPTHWYL